MGAAYDALWLGKFWASSCPFVALEEITQGFKGKIFN